jgi:serine/threonine protein kinase
LSEPPQIDDYVLHELIGESPTGQVWSADYQEQSPLAIKLLNPDAINRQLIFDGLVKVLNGAPHSGINGIYDFDLASETPYITTALHADRVALDNGTEYWQPRSLEPICGQLDDDEAWRTIRQITDALAHLHRLRIAHGGLKPSNILLDGGSPANIKITDIGLGLIAGAEKIEASDTVCYAPPEQLRAPDLHQDGRAERWDVYSFGVVAYRLLTGQFPRLTNFINELRRRRTSNPDKPVMVDRSTLAATIDKQTDITWPVATTDPYEEKYRQIIEACLTINPDQRFADMRDVREAFSAIEDRASFASDAVEIQQQRPLEATSNSPSKRRGGKLLLVAAVSTLLAGIFAIGHLRDGGLKRLWTALTLQKVDHSHVRIDDNGDLVDDNPDKHREPDQSNNEAVKKDNLAGELLEELRLTSETVDEVFRSLITRDSSGIATFAVPDGTLGSILSYYEDFAANHQNNPELAVESARAFNSAGEIKLALGDTHGAIQSTESAVLLLEANYAADPDNGNLLLYLAYFKLNLSEAQSQERLPKTALISARAASELFKTLADRNPTSSPAQRSLVQSYVYLGRALVDMQQAGEADLILDRGLTVLKKIASSDGENEADIAALARIEFEQARVNVLNKKTKASVDLLITSIDRLLSPLLKENPTSILYRTRLADSYALLADVLMDTGSIGDAKTGNDEALALYAELTEELPDKAELRHSLASSFMTLAEINRDTGNPKDALAAAEKALKLLDDLVRRDTESPEHKFDLAVCHRIIADLLVDGGKKDDALVSGNEAIKLMQELLKDDTDPENNDLKRPEYRMALAELFAKLGQQCVNLTRKDDAKTCFEKAIIHFEYLSTDPTWTEQELVQKNLDAAKANLAKLQ